MNRTLLPLMRTFATCCALFGCVDPLDLVGVEEVVHEEQQRQPLRDDDLGKKHPEYDPERLVDEEFEGCRVTLNKSASVTRLTLEPLAGSAAKFEGRVFPTRVAALRALGKRAVLPSMEVVNGALKPFNDGLYAAVELAAETGAGTTLDKRALLDELFAELVRRAAEGATSERAPARAGAEHVGAALALGGQELAAPVELRNAATALAAAFHDDPFRSKPIGFYTWLPELASIFTRDRWLQGSSSAELEDAPFSALAAEALVFNEQPELAERYRSVLELYAGLTNPFVDASLLDLMPFVPNAAALANLSAVQRDFLESLPAGTPGCEPGVALLPASDSPDNRLLRRVLCAGEDLPGDTLLDQLVGAIQRGELDLAPRPDSGWYDHQLYALETLLVPDRAPESEHLLLTREYKEKLIESFKSLLIQTRETHVKQLGTGGLDSAGPPPRVVFSIYPKLPVEPFPTFYLRTARAYRFVEGLLGSVLGEAFLGGTTRVLETGERHTVSLAVELRDKQLILYGLHALAADSIGMAPELEADEQTGFPIEAARLRARAWLDDWSEDMDVLRDPRVSLPVASVEGMGIYWAVVGVKVLRMHASFPETHRPEVVKVHQDFQECVHDGWSAYEPYMLVEATLEARRPLSAAPLNREEFRALCDAHDTVEAIREAFELAP